MAKTEKLEQSVIDKLKSIQEMTKQYGNWFRASCSSKKRTLIKQLEELDSRKVLTLVISAFIN